MGTPDLSDGVSVDRKRLWDSALGHQVSDRVKTYWPCEVEGKPDDGILEVSKESISGGECGELCQEPLMANYKAYLYISSRRERRIVGAGSWVLRGGGGLMRIPGVATGE